jgi:hypothetical protein
MVNCSRSQPEKKLKVADLFTGAEQPVAAVREL